MVQDVAGSNPVIHPKIFQYRPRSFNETGGYLIVNEAMTYGANAMSEHKSYGQINPVRAKRVYGMVQDVAGSNPVIHPM